MSSLVTLGPGWLNEVVALPNNSYQPITNTAWVRARLCNLQEGCTRLAAASDKVYQLLAHGRWFYPGTPASSTTKTGRHDVAESGVKHQQSLIFGHLRSQKTPTRTLELGSTAIVMVSFKSSRNAYKKHKDIS